MITIDPLHSLALGLALPECVLIIAIIYTRVVG